VWARVAQAAAEWERMGRPRDLLWGRRQLAQTRGLDRETVAPREAGFLAKSRAAVVRQWTLGAAATAVLAIAAIAIGVAIRGRAQRELESVIAEQVRAATAALADAQQPAQQHDRASARAFDLFDSHHWSQGEDMWTQVEALAAQETLQFRAASSHFESALSLDPTRAGLRAQFAEITFERLLRAERDHHGDLVEELTGRLAAYDSGRYRTALDAGAHLELDVAPPGAAVWIERPGAGRELLGYAPLAPQALRPGSLVLSFEAPGRLATRLPVLLARDETFKQQIVLPAAGSAPPDMIYVPPGRFLFGSADSTDLRRGFLNAVPLHEVHTGGYYIGRHEVTFGQWIEFLDDLAPDERRRRSPSAAYPQSSASGELRMGSISLGELGPKRWRLVMTPTTRTYSAEIGQRLHYEHRARRADQDWMKFPVAAISYEDAIAFAAWLDRTGRVAGARLCDEYEWERAARGADARTFPGGNTLADDDANIDATYGREPLAFGPDEVGSHPASRSPIGADDMAGNVWEWTRSVETVDAPIARGGGWYNAELNARSMNREYAEPTQRHVHIGVRVCATPK
jgi:formylglycine-generating enzyme required for sulfatase activity